MNGTTQTVHEPPEAVIVLGQLLADHPPYEVLGDADVGTCVQTSRLAVEVLAAVGVSSRVCAANVLAANAAALPLLRLNVPVPEWPDEAWSVGIGVSVERVGEGTAWVASRAEPHRRTGWIGHLVVIGDGWLLDATAGQLARPARQLFVPEVLLIQRTAEQLVVSTDLEVGGAIEYTLEPRAAAFRTTNAWQAHGTTRDRAHRDSYVDAVREVLS